MLRSPAVTVVAVLTLALGIGATTAIFSAVYPATFGAVAFVLAVTFLLASYIPARRAMKVDPIEALRNE